MIGKHVPASEAHAARLALLAMSAPQAIACLCNGPPAACMPPNQHTAGLPCRMALPAHSHGPTHPHGPTRPPARFCPLHGPAGPVWCCPCPHGRVQPTWPCSPRMALPSPTPGPATAPPLPAGHALPAWADMPWLHGLTCLGCMG
eukprot:352231-Chlamydomonas_euryale.AAC.14